MLPPGVAWSTLPFLQDVEDGVVADPTKSSLVEDVVSPVSPANNLPMAQPGEVYQVRPFYSTLPCPTSRAPV